MKNYQSQSHVTLKCKYNRVWCPKYRQKKLYGKLRGCLGEIAYGVSLLKTHFSTIPRTKFRLIGLVV